MPQRDLLLPWLSALDNAGLALRIAGVRRGGGPGRGPARTSSGSASRASSAPGPDELSGGMRQRVAFLRTLMAGRPVLLLDEPFASLDAITRAEMQSWLAAVLGHDRHTVLLVTHDVEEALYLSDRVLVLTSRPARVADRIEIARPRARRPRRGGDLAGIRGPQASARSAASRRRRDERGAQVPGTAGGDPDPAGRLGARSAWDWISNALNIQDFLVPAPSDIATSLWEDRSLLADDTWVTLREVLLGFLCALAAGLGFAIVLHLSETLRRAFYPLLVASQTIPPVAIAPILVVWFGFGLGPKVLLIALVCFFPVTVNTLDGLRSVDPAADHDDADARRRAPTDPGSGRAALGTALLLQRHRRSRSPSR